MSELSRRNFLKFASWAFLSASCALGLGGLLQFLGYSTEPDSPTTLDIGPASNFPPGSRTILPDIPAVLHHTENGFSALSLICTHLGCTLKDGRDSFSCACHGSRFGETGEVLHGPAKNPLTELPVESNTDGHLILHIG